MGSLTHKPSYFAFSLLGAAFLTYQIIYSLSVLRDTIWPEIYLYRMALCFLAFFLCILAAWLSLRVLGGLLFSLLAITLVFFVAGMTRSSVFGWLLLEYGILCFILFRLDQHYQNQISVLAVDREKNEDKKNDMEVSYRVKGEGISIFFEKYSTYYNLRKLAEELAATLSVNQLTQLVVNKTAEFIPRGEMVMITLADPELKHLHCVASRPLRKENAVPPSPDGDPFDWWAIRNRKRLIVFDSLEDFRFDVKDALRQESLRSLILAPLLHQSKVMGTLRINSNKPQTFTHDDLRLLDTISILTSSALSIAILYEQTKELSIRDSLTGLYVQRYFYERLKEEHHRALVTNRALSLLMCDLDRFKEVNDRFGHGIGDLLLTKFTEVLKTNVDNAVLCRYGGEEFAILLPEMGKDEACQVAERIRATCEKNPLVIRRQEIQMTVSIGVASLPADTLDYEKLVRKSDQALYAAKRGGRNRVCCATG